jgi:hypothetical protein
LRELTPQRRMRQNRIELFVQIILNQIPEVTTGASGKLAKIFRKREDVLVILRGVTLQSFLRESSFGPGAIERVIQQAVMRDEIVKQVSQVFSCGLRSGKWQLHCEVRISPVVAKLDGSPSGYFN